MRENLKKRITIGIVTLSLTVVGVCSAFADIKNSNAKNVAPSNYSERGEKSPDFKFNGRLKMTVDTTALVEEGIIDQATADAITDYLAKRQQEMDALLEETKDMTSEERKAYLADIKDELKCNIFDELVTAEIINDDQAVAIKAKFEDKMQGIDREFGFKLIGPGFDLSKLVEYAIIDQATADAISAYLTQKQEEKKVEFETIENMTDEERQAYFENNKKMQKVAIFDELVEEGIINEEQAAAINSNLEKNMRDNLPSISRGLGFNGLGRGFDLSKLIEDTIIDQSTADAIADYLTQKEEEKKAEFEAINNMTAEERKAYFENNKGMQKVNIFDELVEAGIITSEQAAAISESFARPRIKNIENIENIEKPEIDNISKPNFRNKLLKEASKTL